MFLRCALAFTLTSSVLAYQAQAGDLHIVLPKRSAPTPVQRLNRDGVEAVKKNAVDKAKKLFYQAYLLDPDDPFTLNNLGYVSELEGDLDRAQRFYALARGESYDVAVDQSSVSSLKGKSISKAVGAGDRELQANRANIEAMRLLQQDRVVEAEDELRQVLKTDPGNPFALNNMGLVKEKEGDLQGALINYQAAAVRHSQEPVVVTTDREARGRSITEVAERNAVRIKHRLPEQDNLDKRLARLNFLGVYAINHNNVDAARRYFQQALQLAPGDAFSLNNMGYLAELDGDREGAELYYRKARTAEGAAARVTAATRHDAIGMRLEQLAHDNDDKATAALEAQLNAKRAHPGPIQLKRRDNTTVEPSPEAAPAPPNGN
jgi:Flp pilus assembly protein TadD